VAVIVLAIIAAAIGILAAMLALPASDSRPTSPQAAIRIDPTPAPTPSATASPIKQPEPVVAIKPHRVAARQRPAATVDPDPVTVTITNSW
jgi:hypothetical protein